MYCRVAFIENPWYDDHFDIPTERQRIGKTLTMITSPGADMLSRGSLLIGWALYEKLDNVQSLMTQWLDDSAAPSPVVAASTVRTTTWLVLFSIKPFVSDYLTPLTPTVDDCCACGRVRPVAACGDVFVVFACLLYSLSQSYWIICRATW